MFDQNEYHKKLGKMTVVEFKNEVQKLATKKDKLRKTIHPLICRLEEIEELKETEDIDIAEYTEEKKELEHEIEEILMTFDILIKKMDGISKYAEIINKFKNKIDNM